MRSDAARSLSRRAVLAAAASLGVSLTSGAPPADASEASIDLARPRRTLGQGTSRVSVTIPARSFAAVGLFGQRDALLGVTIIPGGPRSISARGRAPLDEDALLPRIVAFGPEEDAEVIELFVDADAPIRVELVAVPADDVTPPDPRALARGDATPRPLVALPPPTSRRDGYAIQLPQRYVFLRIDVALALRAAFRETEKRFRRDPMYVADASQWNGIRPKTDIANPRHISHQGGVDVDVGLPSLDGFPSTVRDHCRGVLLDPEHWGCAPGTIKGVDFERLAHFLGKLIDADPTSVVKVFVDDAYRREISRAAEAIFEKKWIKDAARTALSDEGILVASPWHTDHFHVRFRGEHARPLFRET